MSALDKVPVWVWSALIGFDLGCYLFTAQPLFLLAAASFGFSLAVRPLR